MWNRTWRFKGTGEDLGGKGQSLDLGTLLGYSCIPIYILAEAAAAKSHQSCLTLCDPIEGSPTGSPVSGILQARTLE